MERLGTATTILEKDNKVTSWSQNLAQSYSHQDRGPGTRTDVQMKEQDWETWNKSICLWSISFPKGCQDHSAGKNSVPNKRGWGDGASTCRRTAWGPCLTPRMNTDSGCSKGWKGKSQTTSLRKKIMINLCELRSGNGFLVMTFEAQQKKKKTVSWTLSKLKMFVLQRTPRV